MIAQENAYRRLARTLFRGANDKAMPGEETRLRQDNRDLSSDNLIGPILYC